MSRRSKDEEEPRTGEVSGGDERTEEGDKEKRERDGEMEIGVRGRSGRREKRWQKGRRC